LNISGLSSRLWVDVYTKLLDQLNWDDYLQEQILECTSRQDDGQIHNVAHHATDIPVAASINVAEPICVITPDSLPAGTNLLGDPHPDVWLYLPYLARFLTR